MKILRTRALLRCFALIHDVNEERGGSVFPFRSYFFKNTKYSFMTFCIGPIGLQLRVFAIYTTVFKILHLNF
jgi:hypothetical protein